MKSRLGAGFFCRHLRVACLQANQGRPYEKCTPGPAFQSRLGIGHRKNRTGGNSPNHARAKATLSSTVWFELGVNSPRIRLGVALRRLVLCWRALGNSATVLAGLKLIEFSYWRVAFACAILGINPRPPVMAVIEVDRWSMDDQTQPRCAAHSRSPGRMSSGKQPGPAL